MKWCIFYMLGMTPTCSGRCFTCPYYMRTTGNLRNYGCERKQHGRRKENDGT